MESNKIMREQIFQIVRNQIKANKPPETRLTYQRLIDLGYNEFESKQLIGQCVAVELFHVLKHREPFNQTRFIKNLQKLPKEPIDS